MYHLRRKDKEIIDQSEIKKILKSCRYVTLAMSFNDKPYLVTLNHGFDEKNNCIYFHCAAEGRKIEILKKNPIVWGQAFIDLGYQKGECEHHYESVQFEGKVSFVEGKNEKHKAIKFLIEQLEDEPDKVLDNHFKTSLERLNKIKMGKIDITFLSGKRNI